MKSILVILIVVMNIVGVKATMKMRVTVTQKVIVMMTNKISIWTKTVV
jgi:hypothetical protein